VPVKNKAGAQGMLKIVKKISIDRGFDFGLKNSGYK